MTESSRTHILQRLTVVLSSPAYAGNVGAVARVMANFGVRRGILVAPRCDVNSLEARQYATGSSSIILATMNSVKNLSEALTDANTVIAFTRRTGQMRQPTIALQDIAGRLQLGKVTLVFGPEESGLTDEDVLLCSNVLTLDVSEAMPSVNLSHAVAVVLSHVFKQLSAGSADAAASAGTTVSAMDSTNLTTNLATNLSAESSFNAILADDFHNLSRRLREALLHSEAAGRVSNAERLARILSQTLARSNLDSSELAAWHGLISAINS